jgi:hypothetical protein
MAWRRCPSRQFSAGLETASPASVEDNPAAVHNQMIYTREPQVVTQGAASNIDMRALNL